MFEQRDFFEEQADARAGLTIGGRSIAAGQIGAWMLHVAKLLVLLYTGYHGIHASVAYGGGGLGTFFQAAGIVVVEITLLGLYLAFIGAYINDGVQRWIAFSVYGIGLLTVILTSIADSIATAGYVIPPALLLYLQFGLPVSPVVMLLGGFLVHYFEPTAVRGREEASQKEELADTKFQAWKASQSADLTAKKLVANAMLNAKTAAAQQIATQFKSPEVQAAIKATALANLPTLLSSIGIDPGVLDLNKDGQITAGEVAAAGLPEPQRPLDHSDEPPDSFVLTRFQDLADYQQFWYRGDGEYLMTYIKLNRTKARCASGAEEARFEPEQQVLVAKEEATLFRLQTLEADDHWRDLSVDQSYSQLLALFEAMRVEAERPLRIIAANGEVKNIFHPTPAAVAHANGAGPKGIG